MPIRNSLSQMSDSADWGGGLESSSAAFTCSGILEILFCKCPTRWSGEGGWSCLVLHSLAVGYKKFALAYVWWATTFLCFQSCQLGWQQLPPHATPVDPPLNGNGFFNWQFDVAAKRHPQSTLKHFLVLLCSFAIKIQIKNTICQSTH